MLPSLWKKTATRTGAINATSSALTNNFLVNIQSVRFRRSFNPPFMLSNVKLTPQLDLGSAKTDPANFKSGHWASKHASTGKP
jgi:hypothetical protein